MVQVSMMLCLCFVADGRGGGHVYFLVLQHRGAEDVLQAAIHAGKVNLERERVLV
jgi:hypothetical protein